MAAVRRFKIELRPLARGHVGSVRLNGVAAVGMVWSQPAAQQVAWDGKRGDVPAVALRDSLPIMCGRSQISGMRLASFSEGRATPDQ